MDESQVTSDGRVKFIAPNKAPFLWIHVDNAKTTTSIDTLRGVQAKALAEGCARSGIELTQQDTFSGNVVFNELLESCDLAVQGQLSVFLLGVGLNNGYPWDFIAFSTRADFNHNTCNCDAGNVEKYFGPMLDSFHIYGNPVS